MAQTICYFPTQVRQSSEFSFLVSTQLKYKIFFFFFQDVLTHVRTIPFIPGAKMWYLLYVIELALASVSCEISPRQTSASRATEEAKTIRSSCWYAFTFQCILRASIQRLLLLLLLIRWVCAGGEAFRRLTPQVSLWCRPLPVCCPSEYSEVKF